MQNAAILSPNPAFVSTPGKAAIERQQTLPTGPTGKGLPWRRYGPMGEAMRSDTGTKRDQ